MKKKQKFHEHESRRQYEHENNKNYKKNQKRRSGAKAELHGGHKKAKKSKTIKNSVK